MAEQIRFDLVGRDAGAGRVMKDLAKDSGVAAEQTRRLADAMDAQRRAAATSAGATIAMAKADKILKDSSDEAIASYAKQRKSLDDLKAKQDDTGKSASGLGGRFAALAGTGGGGAAGGGMGALIGAGAALSGQLTTVGFGLGGLALAAYGVAKPIETAAQKAGGLQKNLATLDPEQQKVARSLLGLQKEYGAFEQALQPQVLKVFNDGIRIAGNLMHDVQPVAAATGKALDTMLLSVDKEFQSGTWQSFFSWMAANAGPDVAMLSKNFTDLLDTLPPLIQDLNPLGMALLHVSDDAIKATHGVVSFYDSFQRNVPVSNQNVGNFLKDLDHWTVELTNHLGPWARAINNAGTQAQQSLGGTGTAAQQAATGMVHVTHASGGLVSPMNGLGKVVPAVARALDAVDRSGRPVVTNFDQQITKLKGLITGYRNALTAEENYINAQITEAGDLQSLNQALKQSHDRIGLKTAAERASFTATQTFITQTTQTGDAAVKTGKGIQGQIDIIGKALPALERVKGKTAEYKQELQNLKNILDKLRQEKLISEVVHVSGQGTWRFGAAPGGSVAGPGGRFQGPGPSAAHGLFVAQGTTPTADDVLARVSRGELIVPSKMVAAGLVDHLRGSIPGFAAGGIVPSYKGGIAGLPPWTSHNQQATVLAIGTSIGNAMASSFTAAMSGGGGGALGGSAAANRALAMRMFPWPMSLFPSFDYVEMREAGYSTIARNPSSGAYGMAQFINGPAEYYQYGGNPGTAAGQLIGMFNYIAQRYGNPAGAAAHERAFNWYGNGLRGGIFTRPTMIGVGDGGPERVDVTPLGRGRGGAQVSLTQNGDVIIQDATNVDLVRQRLSFALVAAGLS